MSAGDVQSLAMGTIQGLAFSAVFVLVLFIGFCVLVGFTKLRKTAGGGAMVVKSLDETISHRPMEYLKPTDPRGQTDQLRTPELMEKL